MDFNVVLPALDAALNSLRSLNKNDIVEVNEMEWIKKWVNKWMNDWNKRFEWMWWMDFNEVLPALDAALNSLRKLKKKNVVEVYEME